MSGLQWLKSHQRYWSSDWLPQNPGSIPYLTVKEFRFFSFLSCTKWMAAVLATQDGSEDKVTREVLRTWYLVTLGVTTAIGGHSGHVDTGVRPSGVKSCSTLTDRDSLGRSLPPSILYPPYLTACAYSHKSFIASISLSSLTNIY